MNPKGLAVCIILLLIGTSVIPCYAQDTTYKPSFLGTRGHWLYVGGAGPSNYTKIQDAIDDANPGDTIYVYDDSSPYFENLVINKSLTLIGENKTTTEINGSSLGNALDTVNITGDSIIIDNFSITNNHGYYYQAAVRIIGDSVTVSNCLIHKNAWVGIYLIGASSCLIDTCELYENLIAINLVNSRKNIIQNCICYENADGITLYESSNDNHLINCTCKGSSFDSILIQQSSGNQILGCVCQNGYDGIMLPYAPHTKMRNNTMNENIVNFGIGSSFVSDFYCDIDTSNTINGKTLYFLVEQSNLLFDETTQIGFLGLVSCNNISVNNCSFSNNFEGMLLAGTTDSTIKDCSFFNNDGHGMYLISCQNNTLATNMFQNSYWDGVFLYDSSNNTVNNCSFYGSLSGVNLDRSTGNTLQGLTVEHCMVGVSFDASGGNLLRDNTMVRCGLQVTGGDSSEYQNDVDASNTVNDRPVYYYRDEVNKTIPSDAGQIILVNCTGCIISHCNLSNASIGIELAYSTRNTITDNILCNNSVVAIDFDGADNDDNIISENLIVGNNYGVDVDLSDRNTIEGNMLTDNGMGFSFNSCDFNIVTENTIRGGSYGMYLDHSYLNTLRSNVILETNVFGIYLFGSGDNVLDSNSMNHCSLMVYGIAPTEYENDVDTSNTINGKPLYYLLYATHTTIPDDAGEVILVRSSHCTIKNLDLDKGTVGVTLAYSSNNIIKDNSITNQSMIGIDLGSAENNDNIIQGNIIRENGYGIDLEYSKGAMIRQNMFLLNGYGIFLSHTQDSIIRRNTISMNNYGISAIETVEGNIYLNNINKNYIYGLTAEACTVTARWNWWGAVTGPNTNGDQLSVTENGQITYKPWLRFPVLFAGFLRCMFLMSYQENSRELVLKTLGTIPSESPQNTLPYHAVFGEKTIRMTSDSPSRNPRFPCFSMEQFSLIFFEK